MKSIKSIIKGKKGKKSLKRGKYIKKSKRFRKTKKNYKGGASQWKIPITRNIYKQLYPIYSIEINPIINDIYPIYFGESGAKIIPGSPAIPIYEYMVKPEFNPTIDDFTLRQYHWIKNHIINLEFTLCLTKSQSCPWSPGLRSRAHRACCGFIAPALGAILQYYNILAIKRDNDQTFADELNGNLPMYREIAIRIGLNFYAKYTGYGTSPYSWNSNCTRWGKQLFSGVNIITFYQRRSVPSTNCNTYHHFIVCNYGEFSIIIDSWAGPAIRGEWIRIMYTIHINEILNEIDTTLSLERTNQLLNAYFVVPHHGSDREPLTATLESIEANRQKVLLNVGSYGISEDSWKPIIDELQTMALQGRLLRYGGK